jgi:hypothetical protein
MAAGLSTAGLAGQTTRFARLSLPSSRGEAHKKTPAADGRLPVFFEREIVSRGNPSLAGLAATYSSKS